MNPIGAPKPRGLTPSPHRGSFRTDGGLGGRIGAANQAAVGSCGPAAASFAARSLLSPSAGAGVPGPHRTRDAREARAVVASVAQHGTASVAQHGSTASVGRSLPFHRAPGSARPSGGGHAGLVLAFPGPVRREYPPSAWLSWKPCISWKLCIERK